MSEEKYLIVFPMRHGDAECEEFEGTLKDAIAEAVRDGRNINYDRLGCKIYKIDEPLFEATERYYPPSPPDQHIELDEDFGA